MIGYDRNFEGVLDACKQGLCDKERAIQGDQGILFVPSDSNVQEYKSEFLITCQLSVSLIRGDLDDIKCRMGLQFAKKI